MATKQFFDDLQSKINDVLKDSPVKDIEKNIKALLMQGFSQLDLISREEFDAQSAQLEKMKVRLDALEKQVEALETYIAASNKPTQSE